MDLVVYYSRKGHVRKLAEAYAARHQCDILEIKDTVNRNGILGFVRAGRQAAKKLTTPIEPVSADFSSYDKIVLCTPIWAGTFACPARTFLQEYGQGIRAIDYILMSGSKSETYDHLFDEMDELCGKRHMNAASVRHGQTQV